MQDITQKFHRLQPAIQQEEARAVTSMNRTMLEGDSTHCRMAVMMWSCSSAETMPSDALLEWSH
ncbi:hypothetical protein [Novacetimonas pomaceti]|uniref:hypothetical protein n=1 Tax=Novacetimonas pomaceti TaxID=2021998 RepID=UPI001C2D4870|nr:hypothetical protein [Novacetimonas pomaceti]